MSGLLPCPSCSNLRHQLQLLETRVAELERKLEPKPCAVCSEPSTGRCARCGRWLCVACVRLPTCAHSFNGLHEHEAPP